MLNPSWRMADANQSWPWCRASQQNSVFYPSYQLFRRWELWLTISATRSRYILLRYGSNFEENEHKQVTVYREASTFLLSPYLFFFLPFISFTHHNTSYGHSIQFSPVSNPFGVQFISITTHGLKRRMQSKSCTALAGIASTHSYTKLRSMLAPIRRSSIHSNLTSLARNGQLEGGSTRWRWCW